MRAFHKLVVGIGLAGALSWGVIWGAHASIMQHAASAEMIVKPGHGALALEPVNIQKPGH
jgi:hypothetical protein